MTDGNLTLAVLAEKVGAEAVLRHAARAAKALSGAHITAVHVRVDPISTIMPTEECFLTSRPSESPRCARSSSDPPRPRNRQARLHLHNPAHRRDGDFCLGLCDRFVASWLREGRQSCLDARHR